MNISEGKLKGLKAVSDSKGVIRAAAMDQRGSLTKSIAKEKNRATGSLKENEFSTYF